jgi:hypothetical protein
MLSIILTDTVHASPKLEGSKTPRTPVGARLGRISARVDATGLSRLGSRLRLVGAAQSVGGVEGCRACCLAPRSCGASANQPETPSGLDRSSPVQRAVPAPHPRRAAELIALIGQLARQNPTWGTNASKANSRNLEAEWEPKAASPESRSAPATARAAASG